MEWMRISQICQSYPPMISGAALFVWQLTQALVRRGHRLLVITASDRSRAYTEHKDGVIVLRLPSYPNLLREGQRFMIWPMGAIRCALRDFQPDVLHTHDSLAAGLAGIRAARSLGIPVVMTTHQLPSFVSAYLPPLASLRRFTETALWSYAQWLSPQCQIVIAPSAWSARLMRERGQCDAMVIGNGVATEVFTSQSVSPGEASGLYRKYGLEPDVPIILHVGRLDIDKRVDLVVRAVALAMESVKAQLVVVGGGRQRGAVVKLCHKLGISQRAHFLGYVLHSGDLPGLYRLADVFITASEIETLGLVVLEAMASGLPVVAAQAGALPEIVIDGYNGFLAPPGDVRTMAERLVWLLGDLQRAKTMGQAGQAKAGGHSFTSTVQAHEHLYKRL